MKRATRTTRKQCRKQVLAVEINVSRIVPELSHLNEATVSVAPEFWRPKPPAAAKPKAAAAAEAMRAFPGTFPILDCETMSGTFYELRARDSSKSRASGDTSLPQSTPETQLRIEDLRRPAESSQP